MSSSRDVLQQPFGQLVQMLVQHTALALGKLPHPTTGEPQQNLQVAELMLAHLQVLQEKTEGNLSSEESEVLQQSLQRLQGYYTELEQEK